MPAGGTGKDRGKLHGVQLARNRARSKSRMSQLFRSPQQPHALTSALADSVNPAICRFARRSRPGARVSARHRAMRPVAEVRLRDAGEWPLSQGVLPKNRDVSLGGDATCAAPFHERKGGSAMVSRSPMKATSRAVMDQVCALSGAMASPIVDGSKELVGATCVVMPPCRRGAITAFSPGHPPGLLFAAASVGFVV